MSVNLHGVATVVPSTFYPQDVALEVMQAWIGGDRRTDRLLRGIYRKSGIDGRYSVVTDFAPDGPGDLFRDPRDGAFRVPTTGERNAVYAREAPGLFVEAGRRALEAAEGIEASDVSHVVTVSCTGFVAPGPDLAVVHGLGLRASTQRFHLGFMGCYAAFPALRMAEAFCRADPDAVVLVVCVELCSLHLQASRDADALVAGSVFADGAAATVVSRREVRGRGLRIEQFGTAVAVDGEHDMAWTIGDTGFEMVLSSYVPKIVGTHARRAVSPLLDAVGVPLEAVARWAVHPGGRAILDRIEHGLGLGPEALAASREVLRCYGNMSSATVLYVLGHLLASAPAAGEPIVAMAFGPGLTIDAGVLSTT